TITTQPNSQSSTLGGSVTFTVAASGSAPLSYQWRKNGVVIGGQTSSTLTLSGLQNSDGGSYDVLVSNLAGSVASNLAVLTFTSTFGGSTTQVFYIGGFYTQNFNTLPSTGTFTFSGAGPFYLA